MSAYWCNKCGAKSAASDHTRPDGAMCSYLAVALAVAPTARVLPPEVVYDLAVQAGLADELWFGKHTPNNPDYEDALPKLEKFASLVRAFGEAPAA